MALLYSTLQRSVQSDVERRMLQIKASKRAAWHENNRYRNFSRGRVARVR